MDVSAAVFTHGSVYIARKGQTTDDPALGRIIRGGNSFVLCQIKKLDYCINPVNRVCNTLSSLVDSQSPPVRAFRLISNEVLSVVPSDGGVVEFFRRKVADFLNDRRSIAPAHFKALIEDYECLTNPLDIMHHQKEHTFPLIWFEVRIGYSCVAGAVVGYQRTGAQEVIDKVYETTDALSPLPRAQAFCIRNLRNICGLHNLHPTALQLQLPNATFNVSASRGGFADVFKCADKGRVFAVKVLRTFSSSDLRRIRRRYFKEAITWAFLRHPNLLPLRGVLGDETGFPFTMVSEWMENQDINAFVKGSADINRFKLLADVARGLDYMHGRGIIHGDLKGGNILVDGDGNARIADFGLLAFSDSATTSSCGGAGTVRWMSPELLDPVVFGLEGNRRTKWSDCYALGMTIYEVLTGHMPFHGRPEYAAVLGLVKGERPERPQGLDGRWFTDDVWDLVQCCWKQEPSDRPTACYVLECLQIASDSWTPFSLQAMGSSGADSPGQLSQA